MLKIWSLWVKGLQSYLPSNIENDLTPVQLERRPSGLTRGWAADFFSRAPTLTAGNFEVIWPKDFKFSAMKDLNRLKKYSKYQEASSILR